MGFRACIQIVVYTAKFYLRGSGKVIADVVHHLQR
jgi:hypothetical protein